MASAGVESTVMMEVDNQYTSNNKAEMTDDEASPSAKATNQSVLYTPELLQMYYARLFPFSILHDWLSYGDLFSRREFSMTIEKVPGEEIYIRYQSFRSEAELSQAVLKRRPTKIDIGAVFSHAPKDHKTIQKERFQPVQRELVFDIDLTDYDEVRHCGCTGASICQTCWGFMKMAVKVMDKGLREDFGFERIAWFYSGRRGVHAWVCDEAARELTDQGRSAVASYFEVNLGSEKNKDVHLPHPLHPMLARAFEELEPMFIEQVIPESGHGILAKKELWTKLIESMPDSADMVKEKLLTQWSKEKSSPQEKWRELKNNVQGFIMSQSKAGSSKSAKIVKDLGRVENWPAEVVFRYTYPRLDVNVSKMRNHLLKSPFCVHPKTGRVCVPFQANAVDDFDPFAVPTLPQLMKELDDYAETDGDKTIPDWQKTSLKEYFDPFVKNFMDPLTRDLKRKERDAKEQEAALVGDF